ncbi:MAG: hypothetical protein WEB37_05555, partial [Bacteroidota bacterium]
WDRNDPRANSISCAGANNRDKACIVKEAKNLQSGIVAKGFSGESIERPGRTILNLQGADVKDFLQRMSTNDLSKVDLEPVRTALITEKGKIVDVVTVLKKGQNSYLLCGVSTEPAATKSWLERFVVMDDVAVEDVTTEYRHLLRPGSVSGTGSLVGELQFVDAWGLHVIVPSGAGARSEAQSDMAQLEAFRVGKGLGDWPTEISPEYNPLESGMGDVISWTKGCYVGQEVIARLDTYKKLQRVLVSLLLNDNYETPSNLYKDAAIVGKLTSVAEVSGGQYAGLGFVRPADAEAKVVLTVGIPNSGIEAQIRG